MVRKDAAFLPSIALGTLVLLYFVWAAMHDIAHGDEGTFEGIVIALCVPAFAWLYWQALRILPPKAAISWLGGIGLLVMLFDTGAVASLLRPKYPKDPMLATGFLIVGVPLLGVIVYHLVREARQIQTGTSLSFRGKSDPKRS